MEVGGRPLSKHKRSRRLCPRACPRGRGWSAATALRSSPEPPARDRFQRGRSRTPGPRPHRNPRACTRAQRAPGRRPPAPRLGPRAPTPRRLTGTALPAAPSVPSPRPGPPNYRPHGRPPHSPPRRRCRPPTPPCSCSERRGRGGRRGSEPGARTHGRARTLQAGAAAGTGGGGEGRLAARRSRRREDDGGEGLSASAWGGI